MFNNNDYDYGSLCTEVFNIIGLDTLNKLREYEYCELGYIAQDPKQSFMGFLSVYDYVRQYINEDTTIIDLGCCEAVQAALFKDYKEYIGVDNYVECEWRYSPANSKHYMMSGQEYLKAGLNDCFVITSYVPDYELMDQVKALPNHFVYYPGNASYNDFLVTDNKMLRPYLNKR